MGKSIEVYINDIVKSKLVPNHVKDLSDVFRTLRKHRLRLNASKCSFGVGSGKFLGYMVTHRGIEVSPNQIKAIHSLQPPRNPKEVQKLTRMITALNHFISRSTDRWRPFFLLLNKWKGFDEVLFAYIAVAPHIVSLVLIREDNSTQQPVYYVSKSLHEAEICYLPLKKAVLAIVQATRKLPHNFQVHTAIVLTQLC